MNANVKKRIAVAIALVLLCSFASCGKGAYDPEPADTPTAEVTTEETAPVETTEGVTEETTEGVAEETAKEETITQVEITTEAETEETSGVPKTKTEVIAFLNDALNAVKANRPGFTKVYKRDAAGDISGLPGWLSNIIR